MYISCICLKSHDTHEGVSNSYSETHASPEQVAVVVDTFADARLNDVQTLAEEMEDEIDFDRHLPEKRV